jgi:hypothetical protein
MVTKRQLLIAVPIIMLLASWPLFTAIWPSPDQVMQDFHATRQRPEESLIDPLILHSGIVAPVVIQEIKNPQMDKRRYAILFLGHDRIKEALPVLRAILADETERVYFRADALESIFQIDNKEGLDLAHKFLGADAYLGRTARRLLDGSYRPFRRTYWQAFIGYNN